MILAEAREPDDVLLRDLLGRLAQDGFGTGPLAELRRLDPRHPEAAPPALHRQLVSLADERARGQDFGRWALLVHLLALAAPELHRGGASLGKGLFDAGYSEGRLTRLLEAAEPEFSVLLPRMVRFLVARGERLSPFELADLVLRRDKERSRLRIARDYYRAEARKPEAA
jgi:CRISPR system Cascade subunit CasB